MKRKLCVVQSTTGGYDFVSEVSGKDFSDCEKYTRISEILDVEFLPRPADEVINSQVSSIDSALDLLFEKIQELQAKKQELLSITFQEASND
jgi:hypothetical protein